MTALDHKSHDKDGRLIDRYLLRQLSGAELKLFEDRMHSDTSFRHRVEFRSQIIDGIRISADTALEKKIFEFLSYRKSRIPFGLKMLSAFILVVLTGLLVWNYVGDNSSKKTGLFDFKGIARRTPRTAENHADSSSHFLSQVPVSDSAVIESTELDTTLSADEVQSDSMVINDGEEEIVVRKDQLVASKAMNSRLVGAETKQVSLAADAAKKLNPDAGLPEISDDKITYQVEFWVNPINYEGYRFSGDRLILFGIDNPDACELVSVNGSLYLKSSGEVFELAPSADLRGYSQVRDPELIKTIK
ncbi:MAG: hypothetical protein ACKOA1_10265 [Bacteroidota bacterium]